MSVVQPKPPPKYIGFHYRLTARDVDRNHLEGRQFETLDGVPLHDVKAIREAMKRDGEVVSR